LRILFCNFEYPPLGGGGGIFMAGIARALARRHEVTVLTSRGEDSPALSMDGSARVVRVPVFFRREAPVANLLSMLAYVPSGALRGLFMRPAHSFDVINTHFVVPSGPVGHFLGAVSGVRNVLSVHGGDLYDPSKKLSPHRHAWLRGTVAALLRGADAVVGQSQDTVGRVQSIYGVTRPVELIPLGIDRPPRAPPTSREYFGLPANAFVLVTVGRLIPRKNNVQLVSMLWHPALTNAHLLIVGDGPNAHSIRAVATAHGVSDRVHILGAVNDDEKYRALSVADVFVSTSRHEGFGLMFLEAMAVGLPIVCYDRGGQTDFLKSGVTGQVIPLDDIDAFVHALVELQDSKEMRDRLGANNLRRAEGYSIEHCASRYEQLFETVVAASRHKAVSRM
jgi:glycosyltransferase involved in cell wall biosynthesis